MRLSTTLIASTAIFFGVTYSNHHYYWNVTIYRTQTVDFNILLNLLPTKLSLLLENNNKELIQQTLNANYGLFGVVVTDCTSTDNTCPSQQILYASHALVRNLENGGQELIAQNDYARSWTYRFQNKFDSEDVFRDEIFTPIRQSYSLSQELEFQSPRDHTPVGSMPDTTRDIIGRVYLLRATPPTYIEGMNAWISDIPSAIFRWNGVSSRSLIYNSIAISSFSSAILVWLLLEWFSFQKNIALKKEEKARRERNKANIKLENLQSRSENIFAENILITEKLNRQDIRYKELQIEKNEASDSAKEAQETVVRLERILKQEKLDSQVEIDRIRDELDKARIQEKNAIDDFNELQAEKERMDAENIDLIEELDKNLVEVESYKDLYESDITEREDKIRTLEGQNNELKGKLERYKYEDLLSRKCITSSTVEEKDNLVYFKLSEKELFQNEIKDLLILILKKNLREVGEKTRRYHIISDIINNNELSKEGVRIQESINKIFTGYRKFDRNTKSKLRKLDVHINNSKHVKLTFFKDNRYQVTISKTPSKMNAGKNIISDIRNILF